MTNRLNYSTRTALDRIGTRVTSTASWPSNDDVGTIANLLGLSRRNAQHLLTRYKQQASGRPLSEWYAACHKPIPTKGDLESRELARRIQLPTSKAALDALDECAADICDALEEMTSQLKAPHAGVAKGLIYCYLRAVRSRGTPGFVEWLAEMTDQSEAAE
jgi:hypothetical protein